MRIIIFGNSGSGKSTLANKLAKNELLPHLDLDTLAWSDSKEPKRRDLEESRREIEKFLQAKDHWVIEGCYADLIELVIDGATKLVFLNPGIEACVKNCRNRLWEPHKYKSEQEQNENLNMLIDWVRQYDKRNDEFSFSSHQLLYDSFDGEKAKYDSLSQYC